MNKCEKCENEHDGKYGSGRFCGSKCARSMSTAAKRKCCLWHEYRVNKVWVNIFAQVMSVFPGIVRWTNSEMSFSNQSGVHGEWGCSVCPPHLQWGFQPEADTGFSTITTTCKVFWNTIYVVIHKIQARTQVSLVKEPGIKWQVIDVSTEDGS